MREDLQNAPWSQAAFGARTSNQDVIGYDSEDKTQAGASWIISGSPDLDRICDHDRSNLLYGVDVPSGLWHATTLSSLFKEKPFYGASALKGVQAHFQILLEEMRSAFVEICKGKTYHEQPLFPHNIPIFAWPSSSFVLASYTPTNKKIGYRNITIISCGQSVALIRTMKGETITLTEDASVAAKKAACTPVISPLVDATKEGLKQERTDHIMQGLGPFGMAPQYLRCLSELTIPGDQIKAIVLLSPGMGSLLHEDHPLHMSPGSLFDAIETEGPQAIGKRESRRQRDQCGRAGKPPFPSQDTSCLYWVPSIKGLPDPKDCSVPRQHHYPPFSQKDRPYVPPIPSP